MEEYINRFVLLERCAKKCQFVPVYTIPLICEFMTAKPNLHFFGDYFKKLNKTNLDILED